MKNKAKYFCLIMAIIIFGGLYSFVDKADAIYDKNIDTSEYVAVDIVNTGGVSQNFISEERNLDAISVKTKVEGNAESVSLNYEIKDMETKEIVAQGDIKGKDINNSKFSLNFRVVYFHKGTNNYCHQISSYILLLLDVPFDIVFANYY